jgi:hypothetical protein
MSSLGGLNRALVASVNVTKTSEGIYISLAPATVGAAVIAVPVD